MKPTVLVFGMLLVMSLWLASSNAHEATEKGAQLGQVHFVVSCGAAAQAQFDRAVALLHSFWFTPAMKTFSSVSEFDASCAMAHWGVAMSLLGNPFAWPPSPQALKDGWTAVEKARSTGRKHRVSRGT